jgi:glycogen synthase
MRILIISDLYPPYIKGGYELRCKETADELSRRGHEIIVLTSRWGTKDRQTEVEGSVHRLLFYNMLIYPERDVFQKPAALQVKNKPLLGDMIYSNFLSNFNKLTARDPFRLRRRYYQIRWALKSRRNYEITRELITTVGPDLVFIWNMGLVGIPPILAAQNLGIPTVFSIGDYWLPRLKAELCDDYSRIKRIFRTVVTGLDDFSKLDIRHLLVISTVLKNNFIENGFPEENLHVISRGIDSNLILSVDTLGELPRNHNGNMKLLFVGRIVLDKAPDVAIKALDILRTEHGISDIELDIIGQGSKEYISSLENMVRELKLEKNIRFLGWLEHSRILDLYSDYDALLFPSRWVEPLGGTVLEAMARGLPIIASRRGGPQEIISDGENGLLVPADDSAALARAILCLLQSDELTRSIRFAGIKTIKERHTIERIVDQNLEYFKKVLDTED